MEIDISFVENLRTIRPDSKYNKRHLPVVVVLYQQSRSFGTGSIKFNVLKVYLLLIEVGAGLGHEMGRSGRCRGKRLLRRDNERLSRVSMDR